MKLEKLLSEYLIAHKELTLPGFGHFSLSPSTAPLPDDKKEAVIGDIVFRPDTKAGTPDTLVSYISTQTGKMRPLAVSDLESYLEIGQQLLNISKPFSIEGIGTLLRNAEGRLEFVQGDAVIHGEETVPSKKSRGISEKGDMHFEKNYYRSRKPVSFSVQRLAVAGLVVAGMGLIGWVAWYFYQQSFGESPAQVTENIRQEADMPVQPASYEMPAGSITAATDSTRLQADSIGNGPAIPETETASVAADAGNSTVVGTGPATGFEVVLEVSKRNRALRRYADLKEWGHKVKMSTQDSLTFKLSIPIDAPLTDSTRHRDSLSRFFGRKVWIETH